MLGQHTCTLWVVSWYSSPFLFQMILNFETALMFIYINKGHSLINNNFFLIILGHSWSRKISSNECNVLSQCQSCYFVLWCVLTFNNIIVIPWVLIAHFVIIIIIFYTSAMLSSWPALGDRVMDIVLSNIGDFILIHKLFTAPLFLLFP